MPALQPSKSIELKVGKAYRTSTGTWTIVNMELTLVWVTRQEDGRHGRFNAKEFASWILGK